MIDEVCTVSTDKLRISQRAGCWLWGKIRLRGSQLVKILSAVGKNLETHFMIRSHLNDKAQEPIHYVTKPAMLML